MATITQISDEGVTFQDPERGLEEHHLFDIDNDVKEMKNKLSEMLEVICGVCEQSDNKITLHELMQYRYDGCFYSFDLPGVE